MEETDVTKEVAHELGCGQQAQQTAGLCVL